MLLLHRPTLLRPRTVSQGQLLMKEVHFAILRRHMIEVIGIYVDLAGDELGKPALDERVLTAMAGCRGTPLCHPRWRAHAYHNAPRYRSVSTRQSHNPSSLPSWPICWSRGRTTSSGGRHRPWLSGGRARSARSPSVERRDHRGARWRGSKSCRAAAAQSERRRSTRRDRDRCNGTVAVPAL
jgi:hypothetical protein